MASGSSCKQKQRHQASKTLSKELLTSWTVRKVAWQDGNQRKEAVHVPIASTRCSDCNLLNCHYGLTHDDCHLCLFPYWGRADNFPLQAVDLAALHGDHVVVMKPSPGVTGSYSTFWTADNGAVELSDQCLGCRLLRACLLFLQTEFASTLPTTSSDSQVPGKINGKIQDVIELQIHWKQATLQMSFRLLDEHRRPREINIRPYLDLFILQGGNPLGTVARAKLISGKTSSNTSLRKARDWLSECTRTHAYCRAEPIGDGISRESSKFSDNGANKWSGPSDAESQSPSGDNQPDTPNGRGGFVPRRLIDVGGRNDSSVKLLEMTNNPHTVYICLSHCWGPTPSPCVTTQARIQAPPALRTILLTELPATFRDAVDVTRQLDFRYLWIDSLCIIQDSEEDWREQSSEMASIFQNARLTLAGAWARNDSEGLYSQAASRHVAMSHRMYDAHVYIRVHIPHPYDHLGPNGTSSSPMPLLTRAWVWQERLLSRRVLYFGENELLWECDVTRQCECGSWRKPPSQSSYKFTRAHFAALRLEKPWPVHGRWRDMVESYSGLNLTYAKDRLTALSGVAKVFSWALIRAKDPGDPEDEYLAGLWRTSLNIDLGWRTKSFPTSARPPRQSYGGPPTWSWASVVGAVHWANLWCNRFTILDASTTPVGSDPMGEVAEGSLTIKGSIVRVSLLPVRHGVDNAIMYEDISQTVRGDIEEEETVFTAEKEMLTDQPREKQPFSIARHLKDKLRRKVEPETSFTALNLVAYMAGTKPQIEQQSANRISREVADRKTGERIEADVDISAMVRFRMLYEPGNSTNSLNATFQPDAVFWTDTRDYLDTLARDCFCFVLNSPLRDNPAPALLLKKVPDECDPGDDYEKAKGGSGAAIPRYQRIGFLDVSVPKQSRFVWRRLGGEENIFQLV